MGMIKGKFGQAKCESCQSWHFAIQLDDDNNIAEVKCCRCRTVIPYVVKHITVEGEE